MHITSLQNPRLKEISRLEKRNERDHRRVTVVEGVREVSRALAKGIVPTEVYLCEELLEKDKRAWEIEKMEIANKAPDFSISQALNALQSAANSQLFTVTPEVFARIAYRGESGGVLLVIPYLDTHLSVLPVCANPFLAVIEGVEKPGNLGAILRTADAAGVDGVIVTAGVTDIHNPNVVRASLGTLFSVPIVEASLDATISFLQQQHIQIVAADPEGQQRYTSVDLRPPTALIMGSEASGLSDEMRRAAGHLVSIPMHGMADSLNLATATALMLYEVVRQREAG